MRIESIQSGELSPKTAIPCKKPTQIRLLSTVVRSAISCGVLKEKDFFDRFSLVQLMDALDGDPISRAVMMEQTTGLHVRVGKKKTASECAIDLCLALEEDETNFHQITRLLPWEVCIRGMGAQVIWSLVNDCMEKELKSSHQDSLSDFIYGVLIAAVELGLMRSAAATATLTCHKIAEFLPTEQLVDIMSEIVQRAGNRPGLARRRYFDIVDPKEFVKRIPLDIVWRMVIVDHVAQPLGWQIVSRSEPS